MRKTLTWFLLSLLVLFPILKEQPMIVHAESTDTTDDSTLCSMANVLTWEILQTYLYAVTGQQAYDVYADNSENQQALYSDFVTFCQEMGYGTSVMFEFNKNMAYVGTANLKEVFEYYKTAGTSALKEVQEDAKAQMQVIYGGLNNNISPAPSPTVGAIGVGKKQFCELLGSGALTKYIGNYITQLVNGERGEVSETFLKVPTNGFDGSYTLDENGFLYFSVNGKVLFPALYADNFSYLKGLYSFRFEGVADSTYKGTGGRFIMVS